MSPATWTDWIAWAGIVLPLAALAWSAVVFVRVEAKKAKQRRYDQFFELMEQIGRQDFSIAAKMAAVFELRKYPEFKEVILRLMVTAEIGGAQAKMLEDEFDLTAKHFGHEGRHLARREKIDIDG